MSTKTVRVFSGLLSAFLILFQCSVLHAKSASLKNIKVKFLFYDYKDSSAIHESSGTPTKSLFESDQIDKTNNNNYLRLEELEGELSPQIRSEFEKRKSDINSDYRVKVILWEKALPIATKIKSTKLIPLYPHKAKILKRLDTEETDKNDITFVKELSSTPLMDFISNGSLDIYLPTPIEDKHLYFLGIYITKSNEVLSFEGNNRSISYWYSANPLKLEKNLTPFLEDGSKIKDLKLFVVATDYLEFFTTKSVQEKRGMEERDLVEALRRHLKPSKPEKNRKVVFVIKNASGEIVKKLEVQTGDIAVRLGTDKNIAVGIGPIPVKFENDMFGLFNWDISKESLEKLFLAGATSSQLTVEEMFLSRVNDELSKPFSNPFANYSKESLLTEAARDTRNSTKTMDINNFNFDNTDSNDTEPKLFNRLDQDHKSPYLLTLGDFINDDLLEERLHYYPGTVFFSHAGIISVEENKKGHLDVWVYDAYPKTKQFPKGIRRVPFAEMFGESHGSYGAILRLRDDLDTESKDISTFEVAEQAVLLARSKLIESIIFNPENKVYFDYDFDWQNDDYLGCSEFVWRLFGEGALKLGVKLNLVPNLSMLRIPPQFAKQIGQNVKLLLQISPQDLAISPLVTRISDFDSKMIDTEIQNFSATGEAQDLTDIYEFSDKNTGHGIINIY